MNETYVIMHGNSPVAVKLGRRDAVNALLEGGFKITDIEKMRMSKFLEGSLPGLGEGLHFVGFPPGLPDRKAIRVLGPMDQV